MMPRRCRRGAAYTRLAMSIMPLAAQPLPHLHRASRAASALALALLAACANGPQTPSSGAAVGMAPATGPRARLLLRGAVPGDDQYAVVELTDAQNCKDPRMLSSGDARRAPAPATLAAGLLTTLDFVVLRAGKPQCGVRWSFTPEADKTYLVQGLVMGSGCTAHLLDVTVSDRPQPARGAVLRNGPGQACLPLDQARPAGGNNSSLIQGGQHNGEAVLQPNASARDLQGLIRP